MKITSKFPELKDQLELFDSLINDTTYLSSSQIKVIVWSAAIQKKELSLIEYIKNKVGILTKEEQKIVSIASARMSITNPYFMGRSVHPIHAGGTLKALNLRDFSLLGIEDDIIYHFSCVAFSILNGGYMCFNSHMSSLERLSINPEGIDQAIKLSISTSSIQQILFSEKAFK